MQSKWRNRMKKSPRNVSAVLLDLMFGEPLPVPDVVVDDSAEAWQRWLNAVADQEAQVEFEETRPQPAR
jgi:hypothetical protein